jgi:Flp pilus assembly protein TadG
LEKVCRFCRKNRRGAAAVEFAVVAPLFFLFVFGIIEFGRMVMVQQVLTNASREGARLAVLDGSETGEVEGVIDDYLVGAGIDNSIRDIEIDVTGADGESKTLDSSGYGDAVSVAVSVPFDQVSWLPTPLFLEGVEMRAATVMRRETVQ